MEGVSIVSGLESGGGNKNFFKGFYLLIYWFLFDFHAKSSAFARFLSKNWKSRGWGKKPCAPGYSFNILEYTHMIHYHFNIIVHCFQLIRCISLEIRSTYESPEGSFKIRNSRFNIWNSKFEIRNSISKTTNQDKAFKLRIAYGQWNVF